MLLIKRIDPAEAVTCIAELDGSKALPTDVNLYAYEAIDGEISRGVAVAVPGERCLNVLALNGDAEACALLLKKLMKLAEKNHITVWCQTVDLKGLLEGKGFSQKYAETLAGHPWLLYGRGPLTIPERIKAWLSSRIA